MEARLEQLQRFDRWLLSLKPVEMRFLAFSAAIVMDAAVRPRSIDSISACRGSQPTLDFPACRVSIAETRRSFWLSISAGRRTRGAPWEPVGRAGPRDPSSPWF